MRPPFGSRANAVIARSIITASLGSMGRNSALKEGAAAWIAPKLCASGE
jgi:hypothetical protein